VSQGNVGLVTKFGRFARAVDPGLVYINPLSEQLVQVDIKIQIVEVPKQVCMTKDNVTLNLTSVIYYRITSPHKAAFSISNIRQALVERTQTTLRHVVGARVLQDVIERREEIAQSIREIIEETALGWGVEVESMLVKDIIFSQDLQESLSMAAQSKRTGEAKVIAARAEVESAKVCLLLHHLLSHAPRPLKLSKHFYAHRRMVCAFVHGSYRFSLGRVGVKSHPSRPPPLSIATTPQRHQHL
jgi:erythrocyte band 7 integral membrane protein